MPSTNGSRTMRLGRLRSWLAIGSLLLVNLAVIYTQLAFFPIFSGRADLYFHSFIYFAPMAAAALYLGFGQLTACAALLGALLCVRVRWLPLDYYESPFENPAVAVVFSCLVAALLWFAVKGTLRWRERHSPDSASVLAKTLPLAVALLVASAVVSLVWSPASTLLSYPDLGAAGLVGLLAQIVATPALWLQVAFNAFVWTLTFRVTEAVHARLLGGAVNRSVRVVFQRWLLVVVAGAFLVTYTIGYCLETVQALDASQTSLESHVNYLMGQVKSYVTRGESLRDAEDDLVLSKARAAANILSDEPSLAQSQDRLEAVRDALGLASITVCDGQGTIVADSDGQGIGEFNFGDRDSTRIYLDLLDGTKNQIIEESRESESMEGTTEELRVFAGVPLRAEGFVQVSVEAEDYAKALSAVSLDHLVDDYAFGSRGIACVSHGNKILSSNTETMRGSTFADEFGVEPTADKEWYDLLVSGEVVTMQDESNMGILYLKGDAFEDYAVVLLAPSEDVFAARTSTIVLNACFYLTLFAAVFVLASILLDNVVVRGFTRTNDVLALITNGDLDQQIDEHETLEFDSLSAGINATVSALKDSIAEAEARFDRELATAKAIQESALPRTFPPFPEVERFDIFASMNAAREVGGDFYDFFLIDDHMLGFLIADVSGKGIPASLFMMAAKTEIGNYMTTGMPLAEAIASANAHLCQGNDAGMFVTVWAATLDFYTGELTYVNAGHNPPLLRHEGSWEWLKKRGGLFLGTFETAKYRSETLQLAEHDQLILYTDGVNEAFSVNEEEYGNERLERFLATHNDMRPRALVEALRADVAAWSEGAEQSDDITMVCLEYGIAPEVTATLVVTAKLTELERVQRFVHAELGKRLCPIGVQNKIDIALEEMFVNVCNYAYANQDEPGDVRISYIYRPNPQSITIELDDTGIPFDPLSRRDPTKPGRVEDVPIGGLGILMTKRSVDDISYVRDGEHNILAFTKRW